MNNFTPTQDSYTYAVAVDPTGSSWTTGYFRGTLNVTLRNGSVTSLIASGTDKNNEEGFIMRTDTAGGVMWAMRFGGKGEDEGVAIVVNPVTGTSYTGFNTNDAFNVTLSNGTTVVFPNDGQSIGVLALDAQGGVLWVREYGAGFVPPGGDFFNIEGMALEPTTGDFYLTGWFGTQGFRITLLNGTVVSLSCKGERDVMVLRFNGQGDPLMARGFGGALEDLPKGIAVDATGASYVTGRMGQVLNITLIDGTIATLTSKGDYDAFYVKLDAVGNALWAQSWGTTLSDEANAVAVDPATGTSYVTGGYGSSKASPPPPGATMNVTLANGTVLSFTSKGRSDIFVMRINTNGGVEWCKSFGGASTDVGYGIVLDALATTLYTTGVGGDMTLMLADGSMTGLSSPSGFDVYTFKMDTQLGGLEWPSMFTAEWISTGYGVGVDATGNPYVAGMYEGTMNVTLLNCSETMLPAASWGGSSFLAKLESGSICTRSPTPAPTQRPTALTRAPTMVGWWMSWLIYIISVHSSVHSFMPSIPPFVPSIHLSIPPIHPFTCPPVPPIHPFIPPSTQRPTTLPTNLPTFIPTKTPTASPSTRLPSSSPTTASPSALPTQMPTALTGTPSTSPSAGPTTLSPSQQPTRIPSAQPSTTPSLSPSGSPSSLPTNFPSSLPTGLPSQSPSWPPSMMPSSLPTQTPSSSPSRLPSMMPSSLPTQTPSSNPTGLPSSAPSLSPSSHPSSLPTTGPTVFPTFAPPRPDDPIQLVAVGKVCEPEDDLLPKGRIRNRALAQDAAPARVVLQAPADHRGLAGSWTTETCYDACVPLLAPARAFLFNIYYEGNVNMCTCCSECVTTRDEPR